ncbi:hypothetical protein EIK77_008843 [Talaromyces pinophilus]|nr:hypothetical protein EIK77_008843 [Talaromyces pinophilus]
MLNTSANNNASETCTSEDGAWPSDFTTKDGVSPDYARNDDTNGWIDQGRDGRGLSDSEVLDPS